MKRNKIVYKLTDENGRTYNGTQWGPGISHSGTGDGELCGPGFIHYYDDALLAVLLNPIHADFKNPRLWESKPSGKTKQDNGLKSGSRTLKTIREIPLPVVTTEVRIAFAIYCALECSVSDSFRVWAERWLSGEDRSVGSAEQNKKFSLVELAQKALKHEQQHISN